MKQSEKQSLAEKLGAVLFKGMSVGLSREKRKIFCHVFW